MLNRAGSRHDPITFDEDDSFEDGEITEEGSDMDDSDDSEMYDAEALTINVEVDQMQRGRPKRATVMFPVREAIDVYRTLYAAGFPLLRTTMRRYGRDGHDAAPLAEVPAQTVASRQPSTSTATSGASARASAASNGARDYIFNWGVHSGKHFAQIPDQYLRMIGGNPTLFDKHPGLKEAFDWHRPELRRTGPSKKEMARQAGEPVHAASRDRNQGTRGKAVNWVNFTFPSGTHKEKKLNEVPENYLRTIEGMDHVINKWVGLKEALLDFNTKTGRQGRAMP
jgi:hypothetical protein